MTPAAVLSLLVRTQGVATAQRELGTLDKTARGTHKTFGALGKAARVAGPLIGGAGLAAGVKSAVSEFREAQKVGAQTNAVLKSTGQAAGVTKKHVENLAGAISRKAGIDDEAIQSAENMLLTFTKVRNETGKGNKIFDQATQVVTDMSAALGQSGKSSAIQLGKALNDPIKGITALRRVGVAFTADQQKQIEALVNSGHQLQAQKLILRELTTEFGGSAAAQATAGDKLKVSLGNLAEAAGGVLVPALDKAARWLSRLVDDFVRGEGIARFIIPTFKALAGAVGEVVARVAPLVGWFRRTPDAIVAVATAVGVLVTALTALKILRSVQAMWIALNASFLASPLGLLTLAVAALAAGLVVAYRRSETFRNIVNGAFAAVKNVANAVFPVIRTVAVTAFKVIHTEAGILRSALVGSWNAIKAVATTTWQAINAAIVKPIRAAVSAVKGIINDLKGSLSGAWNSIKNTVASAFQGVANTVIGFIRAILNAINAIPFVKDIKLPGFVGGGGGGGGQTAAAGGRAVGAGKNQAAFAHGGAFQRTGGVVSNPITLMGEEAPRYPEFVIPTNPAYRGRARGLLAQAAGSIGLATGGVFSKADLAALWSRVNPGLGNANLMAAIALAESGGNPSAHNPSGASGLWQILGLPFPGNPFDPVTNARMAGAKLRSQGLGAWEAYTNGAYKRFTGGKGFFGKVAGAVAGAAGAAFDMVGDIIGKLPGVGKLPGLLQPMGKGLLSKARDWIKGKVGLGGGGGGAMGDASPSLASAMAMARAMGLSITSTTGGTHAPGSYHYLGRAFDASNGVNTPQEHAFFRAVAAKWGKTVTELFFDPEGAIKNGRRIPPIGGHSDHVHVAFQRGGMYGPYVGAYRDGGIVPGTGLGLLHKGEMVLPMKKGGKHKKLRGPKHGRGINLPDWARMPTGTDGTYATRPWDWQEPSATASAGEDPNQPLIDAINAQTEAEQEHTQALVDHMNAVQSLQNELAQQNRIASSTLGISLREAQRALADMISGQIGGYGGVGGRALTAGAGTVVRY